MIINSMKKYSPKSLSEFVFPNDEVRELVYAYASGELDDPLILYGTSGAGKSLLQKLIPNAIEGYEARADWINCADLNSGSDIHDIYGRNRNFDLNFRENDKFNYKIIEEFMITNQRINDAFKIEWDKTRGITLTIVSTNHFNKVDSGLVSRAQILELPTCEPHVFFPHAKKIFQGENVEIADSTLMKCLEVTYIKWRDNRKYYQAIDSIFRKIDINYTAEAA